jgi:hypothetical protein
MKKFLLILLLIPTIFAASNQQGMKIDEYPSTTTVGSNDLFLLDYWNGTRFSTNKNISFTNFITQLLTFVPGTGDMKSASNLLDVVSIPIARSNLVAETRTVFNVVDYGAVPDIDCTTIIQDIHDNKISSTNGGVIKFPNGRWIYNLTITKPNITVEGSSHYTDGYADTINMRDRMEPANIAQAVITIGNNTKFVRGWTIRNCTFYGANTADTGIFESGGAFEGTVEHCSIGFFKYCIKVQGGTAYPASLIYHSRVNIQPGNINGSRGVYLVQTANYPTSWTTAISFTDCHIQGPSSGTGSYAMETDSCGVYLSNVYFDMSDDHGVKITKNQTPAPHLTCSNVAFDSNPATGAAIESYLNTRFYSDQVSGSFTVAGKWKLLDGTLLNNPQGALVQNTMFLFPNIWSSMSLIEDNAAFTGLSSTNHALSVSSGNMFIKTSGTLKLDMGSGIMQLDGSTSSGLGTLNIFDPVNSKTVSILGLDGFLRLRPGSAGGVSLQKSDGLVTGLQVNGSDASVFLLGTNMTANTGLYIDSNKQIKSSPTTIANGSTNIAFTGNITANSLQATNGITVSDVAASSLLRTDSNKKLAAVTIGTNLTFDGTTLASTASGSSPLLLEQWLVMELDLVLEVFLRELILLELILLVAV